MTHTPTAPLPSPREVFGPNAERATKIYEDAVDAVLGQCRDRLRRGVPARSVAIFLRNQYRHLAQLAAVKEIFQDAAADDPPLTHGTDFAPGGSVALDEPEPVGRVCGPVVPRPVVSAGTVRYSPFGNAHARVSRKASQ